MQSIFNNANHSLRSALPDSLRLQQPPAGSRGASGFAQVQRFPEFVSVLTSCWSKQESELSPGPDRKLQTQNSAWALQAGAFWKAGVFGGRDLNSCVDNTDNRDLIQAEGGYVKGGMTLKLKQQSRAMRGKKGGLLGLKCSWFGSSHSHVSQEMPGWHQPPLHPREPLSFQMHSVRDAEASGAECLSVNINPEDYKGRAFVKHCR